MAATAESMMEQIARLRGMQQRLAVLRGEIGEVINDLHTKRMQANEAALALTSYLRDCGYPDEDTLNERDPEPAHRPQVERLKAAREQAEQAVVMAQRRSEQLNSEYRNIETALSTEPPIASLEEVMRYHGQIEEAQAEVTEVEGLIGQQNRRIAQMQGVSQALPALRRQREDLLAELATGQGDGAS